MATLHARNVPDEVYERLRARARRRGRSINVEAIELLSRALSDEPVRTPIRETLAQAEGFRRGHRRTAGAPDVVEMIRADRDR